MKQWYLTNLASKTDIRLSPSDKSGGVFVMDTTTYINNMNSLLQDTHTNIPTALKNINQDIKDFIPQYKRIVKKENNLGRINDNDRFPTPSWMAYVVL